MLIGFSIAGVLLSLILLLSESHLKQHSRKAAKLAEVGSNCFWSNPRVLAYSVVATGLSVGMWCIGIFVLIGLLTSRASV